MLRCPRLQTLSCCSASKRALGQFNRVLCERWPLTHQEDIGKAVTQGFVLPSAPLQPGEKGAGEPPKEQHDYSVLCKQAVSRFCCDHLSLFGFRTDVSSVRSCSSIANPSQNKSCYLSNHFMCQYYSFTSGEKLCTEMPRLFMLSPYQELHFSDCLFWRNAEHLRHTILRKTLSSQKCREDDQQSTKMFSKVHICNVKNSNKKSYLSCKNMSPSWTAIKRKVACCSVWTQVRCMHHGAAPVASMPPGKAALRQCLSTQNEARCRHDMKSNMNLYRKDRQGIWAAVLVSLCLVEGEPAFLFTLRSSKLTGRHKGDVSFAGGKWDHSDRDVVDTALREAREELGITVTADSVWGVLKPLRNLSGKIIAPVIANLGRLEELSFRPNPAEVEEVFTISMAHLCSQENQGYTHFRTGDRRGYTLPVFCNAKHRVWGLTAIALDHALHLIVPQQYSKTASGIRTVTFVTHP